MKPLLLFAILLSVLVLVGMADAEDAQIQENYYKEMVCGGYWPDYNKNIEVNCD